MNLKKMLSVLAIGGLIFFVGPHERTQALSLINPGAMASEKMTTEVRWRHHHWGHRHWGHRHWRHSRRRGW